MADVYDVEPMLVHAIFEEGEPMDEKKELDVQIDKNVEPVDIPEIRYGRKHNARGVAKKHVRPQGDGMVRKGLGVRRSVDDEVTMKRPLENETVISEQSEIEGCIRTEGNVSIYGCMRGNISSESKVMVSGELTGDTDAAEVSFNGSRVCGNVKSRGQVEIINGSVLVGDITECSSVLISGAVKGNIAANDSVVLEDTAVIVGDITASAIEIASGASFSGKSEIRKEADYSVFDFGEVPA